jgi:hypothetical protein
MKHHRWIPGVALGVALLLGACAPPNQGAGQSPSEAPASTAPSTSAEPSASPSADPMGSDPSGSAAPTPDDYEY